MNIKNVFQGWKSLLYVEALRKVFSNYKIALDILSLDLVLYFLGLVLYILFFYLNQNAVYIQKLSLNPIILIGISLLYPLIILVIYSFVKYNVLNLIAEIVSGNKSVKLAEIIGLKNFKIKKFIAFIGLNVILMIGSFVIFIAVNSVLMSFIAENYLSTANIILNFSLFGFFYLIFNFAQTVFFVEGKFKAVFSKEFFSVKVKKGVHILGYSLVVLILYTGILFLVSKLFADSLTPNSTAFIVMSVITTVVYYLVHFVNRVCIFMIYKGEY